MAAVRDDRPGLGERYGVAVNASALEIEDGRSTPLEIIVEMGCARLRMSAAAKEAQAKIEAELAPWLWSAAYGDDRATSRAQACIGFADWLMLKPFMVELERIDAGIVRRFAECALHEWLTLRCKACGGSGWQGVTKSGKRVHASTLGRNCLKAICMACRGTGRPRESPPLRMRLLSSAGRHIERVEYDKLWRRQFALARVALREISERPRDHLRSIRKSV